MKTRYRVATIGGFMERKTQVLILQIWKSWDEGPRDCHGMPEYLLGEGWQDATPEDLLINPTITDKP